VLSKPVCSLVRILFHQAKEIASGLRYLHERGVVHGDIKPVCTLFVQSERNLTVLQDNVIISDDGGDQAQLIDFGIAQILSVQGFTTVTDRNTRYTAPELLSAVNARPTRQSDVFSLGVLLLQVGESECTSLMKTYCPFKLFHGPDENQQRGLPYNHVPFRPGVHDFKLMMRIIDGDRPQRERYNRMEDRHWTLICLCWEGNPDWRPTVVRVQQDL
jgi:serine/threonine protein kinase